MAAGSTPVHGPRRGPAARFAIRLLVRVAAVVLAGIAGYVMTELLDGEQIGANIGAGLIGLGAGLLVSVVWGFVDGRAALVLRPPVLLWVAVSAVASVLPPLLFTAAALLSSPEEIGMFALNPVELVVGMLSGLPSALVAAVPAVLAAVAGHFSARRGRPAGAPGRN